MSIITDVGASISVDIGINIGVNTNIGTSTATDISISTVSSINICIDINKGPDINANININIGIGIGIGAVSSLNASTYFAWDIVSKNINNEIVKKLKSLGNWNSHERVESEEKIAIRELRTEISLVELSL